ncbi:hypothetical protein [Dyadobacter sp. CY347]|uniref:hypothetical protein n=1 Tax=Dyadobacter sp. CY347 TaxID=2909336 RepID=UPI001F240454|nr:hypothetical protein [Dyadobacter sp. CY347]MCF2490929.1 hypothetical protein [Dyadobacter sp. CY347]
MDKNMLPELLAFLQKVSEMNEDTVYDSSEEHLVNAIITLVNEQGHTSIADDFNTPFIHPMITIQKWSAELKEIIEETYRSQHSGNE